MHRTHSSCRNASENLATLRSLSFWRTSNNVESPPSSKNSASHLFSLEHPSSFRIKLVYVLSEGIRTNLINNSGSTLFKLCRSLLPPQLISSLLAFARFFQYADILESFSADTQLARCFCSLFPFRISKSIFQFTLYMSRGRGRLQKVSGIPVAGNFAELSYSP